MGGLISQVYAGRNVKDGTKVAIKKLHGYNNAQMNRELMIL